MTLIRIATSSVLVCTLGATAIAAQGGARHWPDPALAPCGILAPSESLGLYFDAVARGKISDPSNRRVPPVAPRSQTPFPPPGQANHTLDYNDVLAFRDDAGVMVGPMEHNDPIVIDLMIEASNRLLSLYGDEFDMVGFFTNFKPTRQFAAAFYYPLENDVTGIGPVFNWANDESLFDLRSTYGLAGDHVEGLVMMYNVNDWSTGNTTHADLTQQILGHEVGHRFGVYLAPLDETVSFQGPMCGQRWHWNRRLDGQGSVLHMQDWVGAGPASRGGDCSPHAHHICFNTDNGGHYSWPDLYLMGYASAAEADAQMSEFRYMVDADCQSDHDGEIVDLSMADIVASEGPRVPDVATAQKDFRVGWIMIYQPDKPPTVQELDDVVAILQRGQQEFFVSTLSRGTMDNSLPERDCDEFIRGDVTGEGVVDMSDGVRILQYLFLGQPLAPEFLEAADVNDDGEINITDPIRLFHFLFLTAPPPMPPFPRAGCDPTTMNG